MNTFKKNLFFIIICFSITITITRATHAQDTSAETVTSQITTTENQTSASDSEIQTTQQETTTTPIQYKTINKGVYVTKNVNGYQQPKGNIIATLKKGIRYQQVLLGNNGYSAIKLNNSLVYVETACLTSTCNAKIYVNTKDKKYSYSNMEKDIKTLTKHYGTVLSKGILGTTADKRKIYYLKLGNPNAKKSLVVETSVHGREWLNTQMIMTVIEQYCRKYDTKKYNGKKISTILDTVNIYIVPMLNPDGVSISQYGLKAVRNAKLKARVKTIANGNYSTWKANARCVDINRNYKEGFGYLTSKHYASQNYAGKKPLSEAESRAIVKLVNTVKPKAVICYHEAGEIIYYTGKSKLLSTIHRLTKYKYCYDGDDGKKYGTFGDFLDQKKITNCTPETCKYPAPVSHTQFNRLYELNKNVLIASAKLYM